MGVMSTVLLTLAAGALFWTNQVLGNVATVPVEGISESDTGVSNWLLVGTDDRSGIDADDPNAGAFLNGNGLDGKRTDTMIVARVDRGNSTIRLMSIPRDLWVDIPGKGEKGRVNGAFNSENGPARLVQAIEQSLDIEINQYAEINFVGFQDVVNSLGGVSMYFDTPMRDPNSGLNIETAGCHTLDGSQAIAFARSRSLEYYEDDRWKTDGSGDLGRSTRQRYFLSRVADTTASKANLFEANEFNRVAQAAGQNLQIGSGTGSVDLFNLARVFRSVGSEGIESISLPVVDLRAGKADVLDLGEGAQDVLDKFRDLEELPEGTVNPSSFATDVLNGSGESGQATLASDSLATRGFSIGEIGDAQEQTTNTIVRYGPGNESQARTVASYILNDVAYQLDESSTKVTLVTGVDFEGVRTEAGEVPGPSATDDTTSADPAPQRVDEIAPEAEETGVVPTENDPASKCV